MKTDIVRDCAAEYRSSSIIGFTRKTPLGLNYLEVRNGHFQNYLRYMKSTVVLCYQFDIEIFISDRYNPNCFLDDQKEAL